VPKVKKYFLNRHSFDLRNNDRPYPPFAVLMAEHQANQPIAQPPIQPPGPAGIPLPIVPAPPIGANVFSPAIFAVLSLSSRLLLLRPTAWPQVLAANRGRFLGASEILSVLPQGAYTSNITLAQTISTNLIGIFESKQFLNCRNHSMLKYRLT
jgi:hypothetical protein